MSSSNLPLATLCLLLVVVYAALSVLGLRFFRYLRQKNSVQKPAEPRWTLAVADETGGKLFKMDIDTRSVDVKHKGRVPSLRSAIEHLVHSGVYLKYRDARLLVPTLAQPVGNFEVRRAGTRIVLEPSAGSPTWTLAPLKLSKLPGEPAELEIETEPLRHQIERILQLILVEHRFLSEARQQILSLSIVVVDLEPGEQLHRDVFAMSSSRMCKLLCCNTVASSNDNKMFTSKSYTKGAVIQNFGLALPKEVTHLTTLAGSFLLFLTWAAFYPGLVFDRTAADCTMSTSSGFCTAQRMMADVQTIQIMTKEVVRYEEAKAQAETTAAYAAEMAMHVNNYTCAEEVVNETALELSDIAGFTDVVAIRAAGLTYNWTHPVPFPDWCGSLRQEWLRAQRRQSCPDERCQTVTVENQCKYFDPSGLNIGATRYCFQEIADPHWPITHTVCIQYEGSCDGTFHDALDQQQADLTDYLEGKARRYSPFTKSEYAAFGEQVKDSVTEMATRFAQDLKFRVDLASDLFIYYCILGLWFPTPFIVNRSPLKTGVKRNIFGLDKRTFVLAVIFVTFFLDIIRELQDGVNLTLYFYNIASNPCFLDGDFLAARAAAISQVCTQLRNYSNQVEMSNSSVASMYVDIEAYGPAPLPYGCGCDYPGNRTAMDAFVGDNQTGLRPFVGDLAFCSNATAQREVLNPPHADVNWWTVWFESGVVAELVLKVTLVNLAHAIVGYTDPLAMFGGRYEVHQGSKALPEAAQDEVAALLSYKHARDIGIWGLVAAVSIFNLLWSGIVATTTSVDTVEAATGPGGTGMATISSSVGGCIDGGSANYAAKVGLWFFFLACVAIGAAAGGNHFLNKLERQVELEQRENDLAERRSARDDATPLSKFKSAVRTQQASSAFALPGVARMASRSTTGIQQTIDRQTPPQLPVLRGQTGSVSSSETVVASAQRHRGEDQHQGGVFDFDMDEVHNPVMPRPHDVVKTRVDSGSSSALRQPPALSDLTASHLSRAVTPPRASAVAQRTARLRNAVSAAQTLAVPRRLPPRASELVGGSEGRAAATAEGAPSQVLPPRPGRRHAPRVGDLPTAQRSSSPSRRAPPPQLPKRAPTRP